MEAGNWTNSPKLPNLYQYRLELLDYDFYE